MAFAVPTPTILLRCPRATGLQIRQAVGLQALSTPPTQSWSFTFAG